MLRFLVLALLVLIVWRATVVLLDRAGMGTRRQVRGGTQRAGVAAQGGEELVRCAVCGTRVPASRALAAADDGRRFCSAACRERAPRGAA